MPLSQNAEVRENGTAGGGRFWRSRVEEGGQIKGTASGHHLGFPRLPGNSSLAKGESRSPAHAHLTPGNSTPCLLM